MTIENSFKDKLNFVTYLVQKFGIEGVEIVKVMKLIFLADVYALRNYGTILTDDKYIALRNGPIASQICNIVEQDENWLTVENIRYLKQFLRRESDSTFSKIFANKNADENYLSDLEKEILDLIFKKYGKEKPQKLIHLTHEFKAWKKHKIDKLKDYATMEIEDFFINDGCLKVNKETLNSAKRIYDY